jgi:hypothetical protein
MRPVQPDKHGSALFSPSAHISEGLWLNCRFPILLKALPPFDFA